MNKFNFLLKYNFVFLTKKDECKIKDEDRPTSVLEIVQKLLTYYFWFLFNINVQQSL
jgi:hypothetical protein